MSSEIAADCCHSRHPPTLASAASDSSGRGPGAAPRSSGYNRPRRLETHETSKQTHARADGLVRRLQPLALGVALAAVTASPMAQAPAAKAWDESFRALPQPANIKSYMEHLSARPASRGVGGRQGQRRVDSGEVQGMGMAGGHRAVRRPVPDAEGTPARARRADEVHGDARRANRRGRSHVGTEIRAAAVLQRVFDRRRRDGAARLRQLRASRGLRAARSPRHLGARRDCHRPLRTIVARHQTEGRGRTRRGRLPDLFRPQRRWVREWAMCFRSVRCGRAAASSAAASWTCRWRRAIR